MGFLRSLGLMGALGFLGITGSVSGIEDKQAPLTAPYPKPEEVEKLRAACPDYKHYSTYPQYVAIGSLVEVRYKH